MLKKSIRIKRLGSAKNGYRILTNRKRPQKSFFGKSLDVWIPQLAPSDSLWENYSKGKIEWEEFTSNYKRELHSLNSQDLLKPLALLSFRRSVVLLCDCMDPSHCPETIVAQSLEQCRKNGNFVVNIFTPRKEESKSLDIVKFLIKDPQRLRRARLAIPRSFPLRFLMKEKIRRYGADLELHETIEHDYLISKLKILPESGKLNELIQGYEKEHKKIWSMLTKLLDRLGMEKFSTLQQDFFNFFAFVESHVRVEEHTFFPTIRNLLGRNRCSAYYIQLA